MPEVGLTSLHTSPVAGLSPFGDDSPAAEGDVTDLQQILHKLQLINCMKV